eukprot:753501-Hanusia_phi.AAC.6
MEDKETGGGALTRGKTGREGVEGRMGGEAGEGDTCAIASLSSMFCRLNSCLPLSSRSLEEEGHLVGIGLDLFHDLVRISEEGHVPSARPMRGGRGGRGGR